MLSKFINWLGKKDYNPILEGVFGSWSYHVPEDKKQQMYDFYMIEYLLPSGVKMYLRPIDFGGEDTDKEAEFQGHSDGKKAGDMSRTVEDKFSYALYEAANKLLPVLKKELLNAVIFSISAELRHVYDASGNKPKEIIKRVAKEVGPKEAEMLRNYSISLKALQNPDFNDLMKRQDVPDTAKGSSEGYTTSFKAMKHAGGSDEDWAKLASWLFYNVKWPSSYGGKAWGGIADGWLQLNSAKNPSQVMAYIDHVYDLQHNTGSVFTKLKSYSKDGYGWIQDALDHKRDLVSPHEMLEHVSPSMRALAQIGIHLKTGKTWHDFQNEWPEILQKKTDNYNRLKVNEWEKGKEAWEKHYPNVPYNSAKPKPVTAEKYAKDHIGVASVPNPVNGQYGPPLYSVGQINKDYWAKVNKDKPPVPEPTYTGDPLNDPHAEDVKIGDKVKINGGSSSYVGMTGTVIGKIHKNGGQPYFTVKFTHGNTHDYKRHRFDVVESAVATPTFKVGDHVIVVNGPDKTKKGVIQAYLPSAADAPIWQIKINNKLLAFYAADLKLDPSGGKSNFKVGDHVIVTAGFHQGKKGVVKSVHNDGDQDYCLVTTGDSGYSVFNTQLTLDPTPKTTDYPYKIGDEVKITKGPYTGQSGQITYVSKHDVSIKLDDGQIYLFGHDAFEVTDNKAQPQSMPEFKVDDPVTIVGGIHSGQQGKIQKKVANTGSLYKVISSMGYAYVVDAHDLKLDTPENNNLQSINDIKLAYNSFQPFMLPHDLKLARTLIYATRNMPNTNIDAIIKNINPAIGGNLNSTQLEEIKKLYQKEKAIEMYFYNKHANIGHPMTPTSAHANLVHDFSGNVAKPFIDMATSMKIEKLIEGGEKIPAVKVAREVLGWSLKSAKTYIEYLTLELISNGIQVKGLTQQ